MRHVSPCVNLLDSLLDQRACDRVQRHHVQRRLKLTDLCARTALMRAMPFTGCARWRLAGYTRSCLGAADHTRTVLTLGVSRFRQLPVDISTVCVSKSQRFDNTRNVGERHGLPDDDRGLAYGELALRSLCSLSAALGASHSIVGTDGDLGLLTLIAAEPDASYQLVEPVLRGPWLEATWRPRGLAPSASGRLGVRAYGPLAWPIEMADLPIWYGDTAFLEIAAHKAPFGEQGAFWESGLANGLDHAQSAAQLADCGGLDLCGAGIALHGTPLIQEGPAGWYQQPAGVTLDSSGDPGEGARDRACARFLVMSRVCAHNRYFCMARNMPTSGYLSRVRHL